LDKSAIIVGGGIIGITSAINLAEAGFAVTVIDREGICEGTSSGNAAALAFPSVLPLAQRGLLRKVPGWLMDPFGPLTVPPSYFLKVMPWLLRLARESAPSKRERSVAAQTALMKLSRTEMFGLADRTGISAMIRHDGSLELYTGDAAFRAGRRDWDLCGKHGVPFEHVSGARMAALQPGLSPSVTAATFAPSWCHVRDPKDFGKALWLYAERLGCRFVVAEVAMVRGTEGGTSVVQKDGTTLSSNVALICAGAWSHRLARQLGDVIPLETERGYNTTLPKSAFDAKRMLIFSADAFVLTPLENGIRIGGAVELGGLDNPPNFKRADAMLVKAKRYLPDLDITGGTQWMGFRPSLPDTLPAIGRSKASPNVLYAFGHGHLGLTQSAATGRLVRDLALDEEPALDLQPFSPQRFG
jgi:D-amino-acid dehydrogenase